MGRIRTVQCMLFLLFLLFGAVNLFGQFFTLTEENIIIQPSDYTVSPGDNGPVGYGNDVYPLWDLILNDVVPFDGIVKTFTLDLNFSEGQGHESTGFIAPIFVTVNGREIRLYKQRMALGPQQRSWALPNDIPMRKTDGSGGLFLHGFRIWLSETTPDTVSIASVLYVTDLISANSDTDHIDGNWNRLAERVEQDHDDTISLSYPEPENTGSSIRPFIKAFGEYPRLPLTPGFQGIKDNLISSMWNINPQQTLDFLISLGEELWTFTNPEYLFGIIGYEYLPWFDNVFFHFINPHRDYDRYLRDVTLYSYFPSSTWEQSLPFSGNSYSMYPWEYNSLYHVFWDKGIPIDGLVQAMKSRAGILQTHRINNRNFTLDELLFQALLINLGYKQFLEPDPTGLSDRELDAFPALETLAVNRAFARILAGNASPGDLETLSKLNNLPEQDRLTYAQIIRLWEYGDNLTDARVKVERMISQYHGWLNFSETATRFPSTSSLYQNLEDQKLPAMEPSLININDGRGGNDYWNVYQVPSSPEDFWFSAHPTEISGPPGFISLGNIDIDVYGMNQDYRLTILCKDENGLQYEFSMEDALFEGKRRQTFNLPAEVKLPPLMFQEIRVYKDASNSIPPDFTALEVRLGRLNMEAYTPPLTPEEIDVIMRERDDQS